MEHYYNKLEHWFDYEDVFLEAIQKAKDGDLFVEIGVWKGGSAAFMGVEISNSGKKIRYDAIDCFAPTQEFGKLTEDIYEEAKLNLKPLTDLGLVNLIKAHSLDVVSNYEDNSLSLVFIPEDLRSEFDKNPTAFDNYQNFAPSYRKSYLYWLNQAKREATRQKRITEIIQLCAHNIKSRGDW